MSREGCRGFAALLGTLSVFSPWWIISRYVELTCIASSCTSRNLGIIVGWLLGVLYLAVPPAQTGFGLYFVITNTVGATVYLIILVLVGTAVTLLLKGEGQRTWIKAAAFLFAISVLVWFAWRLVPILFLFSVPPFPGLFFTNSYVTYFGVFLGQAFAIAACALACIAGKH
jgi:hypothetical protein